MADLVAIRHEDKSVSERRVPLTPGMVKRLIDQEGLGVLLQPSDQRVFTDAEFARVGATVTADISASQVIFGVKDIISLSMTRIQWRYNR